MFNKDKTELIKYPIGRQTTTYTINEKVEIIGEYAFENETDLTEVIIPDSIKTIGKHAFEKCESIITITIPTTIEEIGEYSNERIIRKISNSKSCWYFGK